MKKYCYDYPRPSFTVDAIIISKEEGKVLLIKRKFDPFAGLWAFPGGFMDMNETPEEAIVRELKEETNLSNINLMQFRTYGSLNRDPRGRTISTAYVGFVDSTDQYEAIGLDDAEEAKWHLLTEIPQLAFDHSNILKEAISHFSL